MTRIGERAPDFALPALGGGTFRLSENKGRPVVLYFYPKDHTPGCTAEAKAFRDRYETFTAAGAEIVGVSSDSIESHQRFAALRLRRLQLNVLESLWSAKLSHLDCMH